MSPCFHFLSCEPRSGMAGSERDSVFHLPRDHRGVSRGSCTVLPSPQQFLCIFASARYLLVVGWFTPPILKFSPGDKISGGLPRFAFFPVIIDVEHLFVWLLSTCVFSLEECLFRSFARCESGNLFCCYWRISLYTLDINSVSDL